MLVWLQVDVYVNIVYGACCERCLDRRSLGSNSFALLLQVEFMSQELTTEWKGWMILTLVAINYSGMDQVAI